MGWDAVATSQQLCSSSWGACRWGKKVALGGPDTLICRPRAALQAEEREINFPDAGYERDEALLALLRCAGMPGCME